jgi:hypothetical protein
MPECIECGEDLEHVDVFGTITSQLSTGGDVDTRGDIWRCTDEECDGEYFYTLDRDPGNVHRGYPC